MLLTLHVRDIVLTERTETEVFHLRPVAVTRTVLISELNISGTCWSYTKLFTTPAL